MEKWLSLEADVGLVLRFEGVEKRGARGRGRGGSVDCYWALFRLALPSILLQSGAPLAITVQTALLGRKDTQLVAAWAVMRARGVGMHAGATGMPAGARGCAVGPWRCARAVGDARVRWGIRAYGMGMRAETMGMRGGEHGDARGARGSAHEAWGCARTGRHQQSDELAGAEQRQAGPSRLILRRLKIAHWPARLAPRLLCRLYLCRHRADELIVVARAGWVGFLSLPPFSSSFLITLSHPRSSSPFLILVPHHHFSSSFLILLISPTLPLPLSSLSHSPSPIPFLSPHLLLLAAATNAATVIFNFLVVGVTAKVTKVVAVGAWAQVGVRIRLALAMALATSALAVALLLSSQGLLWALLSDSPSVLQYAKSYFYLRVMGVPPQLLVMCTSGVLQGYKHVALVAWLQAARALLDVAASYLSLYVLDWGIVGVGIGTFLASCTVAAVSLACILLLPPPQGKGKIVVFPPILSFLARKVAVPQVLLCRALSQRVSRTCSKVRVGGAAALADAQVLLLDGREREGTGKEVGGIEETVLAVLEGRMLKAGRDVASVHVNDQRAHGCAREDEARSRDEQATRVGGREEEGRAVEGGDEEGREEDRVGREGEAEGGRRSRADDATHSRMVAEEPENEGDGIAYNEDMVMGGDGRGMREGGCAESVEVRVVVGREETSTVLLLKTGEEERVEKGGSVRSDKGGSGGSNIGERRVGEKGEGAEGKCKAEEMEEARINENFIHPPSPVAGTLPGTRPMQLSFFLVLACATSLGVHAVAAHQPNFHPRRTSCGRRREASTSQIESLLPRPKPHPSPPPSLFHHLRIPVPPLQILMQLWMILMQLWMVNIYIADGFSTAGTIVASSLAGRMAQAQTRGEHATLLADLRLVCWRVLRMGLIAGILICAAYTSLERHIVALFTYDEATKAQLRHVWLFLALMQPLNSVVFVYDGLIYAAQAFSYMAACLAVGFFTLFLPIVSMPYFALSSSALVYCFLHSLFPSPRFFLLFPFPFRLSPLFPFSSFTYPHLPVYRRFSCPPLLIRLVPSLSVPPPFTPLVYLLPLLFLLLPPASLAAFPFPFHQLPLLPHLFPSLPFPFFQFKTFLAAWAANGVLNTMTSQSGSNLNPPSPSLNASSPFPPNPPSYSTCILPLQDPSGRVGS
ncbi:unnamed protein product [Closterium sp. NIES-65]|nr:unnamed protein product [Closterium sp. NIES-65]